MEENIDLGNFIFCYFQTLPKVLLVVHCHHPLTLSSVLQPNTVSSDLKRERTRRHAELLLLMTLFTRRRKSSIWSFIKQMAVESVRMIKR